MLVLVGACSEKGPTFTVIFPFFRRAPELPWNRSTFWNITEHVFESIPRFRAENQILKITPKCLVNQKFSKVNFFQTMKGSPYDAFHRRETKKL